MIFPLLTVTCTWTGPYAVCAAFPVNVPVTEALCGAAGAWVCAGTAGAAVAFVTVFFFFLVLVVAVGDG